MRFFILVCLNLFAFETQAQIQNLPLKKVEKANPALSQALVTVEYRSNVESSDDQSFRVIDPDTKAKATVIFSKSSIEPGLWRGVFSIQFARGETSSEKLEFYDPSGKRLFQKFVVNDKKQKQIKLFSTEAELKAYEAQPVAFERVSMEEQAALQKQALADQQTRLSKEQKAKQIKKAKTYADHAMSLYKAGKYPQAIKYFNLATEFDPENLEYLYQYAICLYKNKEYNRSLALLSLSEGSEVSSAERNYYTAMNYMMLKDRDRALKGFIEVKEENEPGLSPMAAFYAGHLEYQKQNFSAARKHFESVIDTSKNPKLDKEAEKMLDEIDRQENFLASSRELYHYTLYIGPQYDSNVLNIAAASVSTGVAALRANYGGTFGIYLYRVPDFSVSTELAVNDYYSTKTDFSNDATLQTADALEGSISLPIHWEKFDFTPAYKTIYLAPSGGTRTLAIVSSVLGIEHTGLLNNTWILHSKIEGSSDQSKLEVTSTDDSQTGTRTTINLSFIKLFDLKGENSLITDIGYTRNQTEGINYRSTKPLLALTYTFPGLWRNLALTRLEFYQQAFTEATTTRTDQVATLTVSQNKKLSTNWDFTFGGQFSNSASNVDTYKYNKYMATTLFTYSQSVPK
ncbi:MAG: hypothetical protein AABY64_03125 [Bdellovibrionota bacterium]